jgi:hypothetical protein
MRTIISAIAIFASALAQGALYFDGTSNVQAKDCPRFIFCTG